MTCHSPRARAFRGLALMVASLYLLVFAVSPAQHHDFACHQQAPGHCQACVVQSPALGTADVAPACVQALVDAGAIETADDAAPPRTFAVASPGRAPPVS